MVYDGDGNRVSKGVAGVTTNYVVADVNPTGYAQVLEERSGFTGDPPVKYVWGSQLVSQTRGTATRYYGLDGHGSVLFLTDENGAIKDAYTYDAFGVLIDETHLGAPVRNIYLYAGEQFDSDLGLRYNRARYLNGAAGRFGRWIG